MKRGGFLLGALSGLAIASAGDGLFGRALAAPALAGGGSDHVLVLVNLQGGNDGLNTVVPYAAPEYYRYRPSLGVAPGDVLHLDGAVGLNPKLRALKAMYDRGDVAVVQGVGYPQPDHSHFRSTEIWQTAAPARYESTGWLGRYLDDARLPPENLFNAVAVSEVLPEALVATTVDVPAVSQLRGYGLRSDRSAAGRSDFAAFAADRRVPFSSPYLAAVSRVEGDAQRGAEELPRLLRGYTTTAAYPATPIGRSLALAAQIVGSGICTRVVYVQHGSFDTHVSQRTQHDRLLEDLANAVAAFYDDLAAHGNAKRVLTLTFSEFGRRVQENASRGTDHGEAAPLFVIGGGVRGGLYGRAPSLDRLENGDVTYTTDFRSVYAPILERWLGRDAAPILGGVFAPVPILG